jgi:hypothetical protein
MHTQQQKKETPITQQPSHLHLPGARTKPPPFPLPPQPDKTRELQQMYRGVPLRGHCTWSGLPTHPGVQT